MECVHGNYSYEKEVSHRETEETRVETSDSVLTVARVQSAGKHIALSYRL